MPVPLFTSKCNSNNEFHVIEEKKTKLSSDPQERNRTIRGFRDFANTSVESLSTLSKTATGRVRPQDTFPVKLHRIIERSQVDGYSGIISWLPHGRAFQIIDTEKFLDVVACRYFFLSKYTSFQRQLNIYGFRKMLRCRHVVIYCHELFMRGRHDLCKGILRLKFKPIFDPADEPDFSKFEPLDDIAAASMERMLTNIPTTDNVTHNTIISDDSSQFCPLKQLSEISEVYRYIESSEKRICNNKRSANNSVISQATENQDEVGILLSKKRTILEK